MLHKISALFVFLFIIFSATQKATGLLKNLFWKFAHLYCILDKKKIQHSCYEVLAISEELDSRKMNDGSKAQGQDARAHNPPILVARPLSPHLFRYQFLECRYPQVLII